MTKLRLYKEKMLGFSRFRDALNAIQMIGASELRSLKYTLDSRFGSILNIANLLLFCMNDSYLEYDYLHNNIKQVSVISFSVDQTGCGVHNQMVFESITAYLDYIVYEEGYDWNKLRLFCTGFRARSYFLNRFKKSKIYCFYKLKKDKRGFLLSTVIDRVVYSFISVKYIFIFNRFQSAFKAHPSFYEIFNFYIFLDFLSYGDSIKAQLGLGSLSIFNHVCNNYSNLYNWYRYFFLAIISDCVDDNEYSSIGSKIIALMSAVKNTETILEEMNLIYNKLRQEVITTELLEFGLHVMLHETEKKYNKLVINFDKENYISNYRFILKILDFKLLTDD